MSKSIMRKDLESFLETAQSELLRATLQAQVHEDKTSAEKTESEWDELPTPLRKAFWSLIAPLLGRIAAGAVGGLAGRAIGRALAGATGATIGGRLGQIIGVLGGWDAVKSSLKALLGRENPLQLLSILGAAIPALGQFVAFLQTVSPNLVSEFGEWLKRHLQRMLDTAPPPTEQGAAAPRAALAKALVGAPPPYVEREEEVESVLTFAAQFLVDTYLAQKTKEE